MPALRYSNALDALFHEQTVLCEDHSDCMFYGALYEHICRTMETKRPDTIFLPCGGKHAMPSLIRALREFGVSVRVIVDLDVLSESNLLKKFVDSFGADWDNFKEDWRILSDNVLSGRPPKTADSIKEDIVAIIDNAAAGELPKSDIKSALASDNAWNHIKRFGESAIPKGDARQAYERIKRGLRDIGILIVPKGEIEGFCPSIGGHGTAYVTAVLETYQLDADELREAREFVSFLAR